MKIHTTKSSSTEENEIFVAYFSHTGNTREIVNQISVEDITKLCPQSTILERLAVRGSSVKNSAG